MTEVLHPNMATMMRITKSRSPSPLRNLFIFIIVIILRVFAGTFCQTPTRRPEW